MDNIHHANSYNIEEIVKVFDEELILKGRDYLKISEANDILLNKKIFNQNDYQTKALRKLLESGKIPHAYLANTLPPQWRIPNSTAENENPKINPQFEKDTIPSVTNGKRKYVSCPHCYKSSIYVRMDDREKPLLSCPKCNGIFTNPLLNSLSIQNPKVIKRGAWILGIIIFLIFYLIFNNNNSNTDAEKLAKYENSVHIGWDYSTWLETTDEDIWGNDLIALPGTNNNIYIGYWVKPNITIYLDKRTDKIIKFVGGKGD